MAMRRWLAFGCIWVAACGGGDEGISSHAEAAQVVAELTVVAYEGLLAGIGGEVVDGVVTVPCSAGGTLAATVAPAADGKHDATFAACTRGGNAFTGMLRASFGSSGGAFTLGYSGELVSAGPVGATLTFTDVSEMVMFMGGRSFTMRLDGTVVTDDAGGRRTWTFDDRSYAYDDATGEVTEL
jgi:hypothetical protein